MPERKKSIYNIPAGVPFAKAMAIHLLEETKDAPETLSQYRIFLPTRRACRTLRDVFLKLTDGKPLLLPIMQPLGDMDEEELSLTVFDGQALDIPPGITPLRRQLLLARTIQGIEGFTQGPGQALMLAEALGRFIDQIAIEELDIANLSQIVPEDFADHWQITLDFLKILSEHWPQILAEQNVLDTAERRKRLTYALIQHWRDNPPSTPIIAAGSTGSMPATATLMAVISELPRGTVILPGLDTAMDDDSWTAIEESHPQYGLKQLLHRMDVDRDAVAEWPEAASSDISSARRFLAGEMMRPTETSGAWQNLATSKTAQDRIRAGLQQLKYFECETPREEAQIIALTLRETLETKKRTAALITPDRTLARRVAMMCQRWGIQVDDSAGCTLAQTDIGTFLNLGAEACLQNLAPVALLSLLKHRFCFSGHDYTTFRIAVEDLEALALRGLRPAPGIEGLNQKIQDLKNKRLEDLVNRLDPVTHRFVSLLQDKNARKFSEFLHAHLEMTERLVSEDHTDAQRILWSEEAGETASSFLAELDANAEFLPRVTPHDYVDILSRFMSTISVRPRFGTHPRLTILGQLEARLIDADLLILANLNEGSWPPLAGHDPWMSRPMRKTFGLPAPERSIGLAAHDFVQGFCADDLVLTRSRRVDGAPSVPARWLQRMETVLKAADAKMPDHGEYKQWAQALDAHGEAQPRPRPAPTPPADKRPVQLSVTKIETWLKDPYQIYARSVLGLKKLDPLEKQPEAAERGTLLHDILDRFVSDHPDDIPGDAEKILYDIAQEEIEKHHDDPAIWSFWWPRFHNLAHWFVGHEKAWRQNARPLQTEVRGTLSLGSFTLTAIADRIDQKTDGSAAIIDYKSGGTYAISGIESGKLPQLPLEAAILQAGGFEGIAGKDIGMLAYWTLTGGRKPGDVTALEGDVSATAERAKEGLESLIAVFQDPATPYYSVPRPDDAPRFNDYAHLARVKEWAALDDAAEEAA